MGGTDREAGKVVPMNRSHILESMCATRCVACEAAADAGMQAVHCTSAPFQRCRHTVRHASQAVLAAWRDLLGVTETSLHMAAAGGCAERHTCWRPAWAASPGQRGCRTGRTWQRCRQPLHTAGSTACATAGLIFGSGIQLDEEDIWVDIRCASSRPGDQPAAMLLRAFWAQRLASMTRTLFSSVSAMESSKLVPCSR